MGVSSYQHVPYKAGSLHCHLVGLDARPEALPSSHYAQLRLTAPHATQTSWGLGLVPQPLSLSVDDKH